MHERKKLERGWILAPLFLVAQLALVQWAAGGERPPAPPDLSRFPAEFGGWKQFREDPIAADVAAELGADRVLSRTYIHRPAGLLASLLVVWYQSQRSGHSQPHSPQMCLPGSGWMPEATGEVTLDTPNGAITVNRYLVANGRERAAVLFWYQRPRRVVAGEWAAKLWLVADAIRDQRTDTSLVRIVVWEGAGGDDAAMAAATGLARSFYPLLRERLPR
jgi:EpsI family protein